ncbi:hypothetical protein MNBD_NITROSPINAE02-238 [hydrothermal vent metagenome]|uniref:Glycosyltransferase RgtA/B/C/D-like domain-containing protein n=1 Tax=hydrothermal vent metagenome TaxID=652676 RepID=A0A3B1D7X8_9ZZZZ
MTIKNRSDNLPANKIGLPVFILSSAILAAGALKYSIYTGGDYERYISLGNDFWNYFFTGDPEKLPRLSLWAICYFIPNLIIAGGVKVFGSSFHPIFVCFNISLYSIMTVLFFKVWSPGSGDRLDWKLGAIGFALIFGLPTEVLSHNYNVLSDVIFLTATGAVCYFLANAVLLRSGRDWRYAFAAGFVTVFIRPPGLMIIVFLTIAAVYVYLAVKIKNKALAPAVLIIGPACFALLVWPALNYFKVTKSGLFEKIYPASIRYYYESGMVVAERPEMYLPPPEEYFDYVHIVVNRLFYYFYPLRETYSTIHNVYLLIYAVLIVSLIYMGWRKLAGVGVNGANLAFLLFLLSFYFGLFHSMLFVEDFRYQLPSLPPLWMLAGFATARLRI